MAQNRRPSLGAVGLAFMGGGLVGAALALVMAPKSGRESREEIQQYVRRAEGKIHDWADSANEVLDQAVEKGHEFIKRS
jgi:gas vesicle protein